MFQQYQQYQQPFSAYAAVQPQVQNLQPVNGYQPRGISGKAVSVLAEVTVNDVPSDGSRGYFPAHDGSCIWAKQWRSDGTIETTRYVPEAVPEPEPEPDRLDEIMARLDAIEAALKPRKRKAVEDE